MPDARDDKSGDQTRDEQFREKAEAHFFAYLETVQVAFNKFIYDRIREYAIEQENKLCKCPHCGVDFGTEESKLTKE